MNDRENDSEIKVIIRTGTSTRRPVIRTEHISEPEPDRIPVYTTTPLLFPGRHLGLADILPNYLPYSRSENFIRSFRELLSRSLLSDGELKRDDARQLDIQSGPCPDDQVGTTCIVCQDVLNKDDMITALSCSHIYHSNCLAEWGKYNPSCPQCRKSIPVLETENQK